MFVKKYPYYKQQYNNMYPSGKVPADCEKLSSIFYQNWMADI